MIVFLAFTSIHLCTEEHQTCNASEQLHMLQMLFWGDFQLLCNYIKSKVKSVEIKGLSKIKLPTWAITPYLKTFLLVCWSKFDSHGHLGQVGHLDWQIDCYDLIKQVFFLMIIAKQIDCNVTFHISHVFRLNKKVSVFLLLAY